MTAHSVLNVRAAPEWGNSELYSYYERNGLGYGTVHKDISILEEDNSQIYAHLDNVLVHMIDNQQTAIFKLNQDFNKNKEKIAQYIKYAENWQVASVIFSYTAMACDVLLIVAMIVFLLKYRKTMQVMLTSFLQINTKNTGIQSVQADQIGRTYPPLFTLN